jgi:glycolate oxidase FAD binding subunit
MPQVAAQPELAGDWLIEWGGAQRWLRSDAAAEDIRAQVTVLGGHATLFHGGDKSGAVFQPLTAGIWQLHQRLKQAFDPAGILNPGRMYENL